MLCTGHHYALQWSLHVCVAGFTQNALYANWLHLAIQVEPTFLISDIRALWMALEHFEM